MWVARHWEARKLFHEGLLREIELLNLKVADVVVVVSRALAQELQARGVQQDKILINPNGVDPNRYTPELVDGSPVRARCGLERRLVVGFVGTFRPWHGAEVLAKAFGQLIVDRPDLRERLHLLMIGDGPTLSRTKEILTSHGVAELATFTGRVPQAQGPDYLAACDILVTPQVPNPDGSPFFGSPTKLFEYMAMGKAVVASNLDQLGELLEHDRTAWLVKPGNSTELAEGLRTLIEDPSRRERLGTAARDEVVARHTWREHVRRIVEMVKDRCG
jgi:glycosyltransferase involved in cell wall biosynthesis